MGQAVRDATARIFVGNKPNGHGSGDNPKLNGKVCPQTPSISNVSAVPLLRKEGVAGRPDPEIKLKKEGGENEGLPTSNTQTSKNVHPARQWGLTNLHTPGRRWGQQATVHPAAFMNSPQNQEPQRKSNC